MKTSLIITFLLIITVSATGQIIDRISFNYGITSSDLEWNYEQDLPYSIHNDWGNQKIIGFYSGLDFEYLDSKYFALSTGIGFYQRGAMDYLPPSTHKWDLDYLTFDTKVKVKYDFNNFIPYLIIGPRIDYLLKYSSEFDEFARLEMLNKFNYGLRYGLGMQYDFGKFILGFAWKNNLNFNSIGENDGEYMSPPFKINDKTIIFNLDIGIGV
jgi:hypothetical protein